MEPAKFRQLLKYSTCPVTQRSKPPLRVALPFAVKDHIIYGEPLAPALHFKLGRLIHLVDVPQTQVADDLYAVWDIQQAAQIRIVEHTDPPHADAFRARGKPKVLDRANGAIKSML